MGQSPKLFVFLLCCIFGSDAGDNLGRRGGSPPLYLHPEKMVRRTSDNYSPDISKPPESSSLEKQTVGALKTPRGFADFVSDNSDRIYPGGEDENNGWSQYNVPGLKDSMYESGSDWNAWRRQDDRASPKNTDLSSFPGFSPDYTDMMMMMHAMKKMDTAPQKPGIVTRILENPAALVMATFIPLSLIMAAALPLIVNVMMTGFTIPALIPTTASRARSLDVPAADFLLPILDGLADLGSKYLEDPDCVQRVFCHTATNNDTSRSHPNFIKNAVDKALFLSDGQIFNAFGIKALMVAIRDDTCDSIPCPKADDKSKQELSRLINGVMFNHSLKKKPERT